MNFIVRNALSDEFQEIGRLMVSVYSSLKGFPSPKEQPKYYEMLSNIGEQTNKPCTELLAAVNKDGKVLGAVVYFSDMLYYGSGGSATQEKNASGFRLLAVDEVARGMGVGKALSEACIKKARDDANQQLIIHTTSAMQIAWAMYEKLGFKSSKDLDFMQQDLQVFGFRKEL